MGISNYEAEKGFVFVGKHLLKGIKSTYDWPTYFKRQSMEIVSNRSNFGKKLDDKFGKKSGPKKQSFKF